MWSRRGTLLSDSSPTPFISLLSEQSTRMASATPVRSPSLSGRRVSYIRWKKKKILFWCNVFHYIIHSSVLISVSMRQYILDTGCRAEAEIMCYMLWKNKTCFACAVSKLIAFSVWCSSAGSNVEFHQKVVPWFCWISAIQLFCFHVARLDWLDFFAVLDGSPTEQGVDHRQVQRELGEVSVYLQKPMVLSPTSAKISWSVRLTLMGFKVSL